MTGELDQDHYPAPPSPLEAAMTNMDRSVTALLLEVPELVYQDVQDRWSALRKLIAPQMAPIERFVMIVSDEVPWEGAEVLGVLGDDIITAKQWVDNWILNHKGRSRAGDGVWSHREAGEHGQESWWRRLRDQEIVITRHKVSS